MKKKFLVSGILTFGLLMSIHAQGIPLDIVGGSTVITDCETGQPVGSGYVAALYWGSGTDRRNYQQVGGTMSVINGRIFGGGRTITAPGGIPSSLSFYGAAWQSAAGSSYETASQVPGAKVGQSDIFTVTPLSPPTPTPVRIPDFQVCPVPEPSAIVLVAVGLGSLALIRFRKPVSQGESR